MRKTLLSALIAGAFAAGGSAHAAGLVLDLDGAANAGGVITAEALDWAPTSFLALGGNTAIAAFERGACAERPAACQFDVLTHAKLTAYKPVGGAGFVGLPSAVGEITMVARFTETVVGYRFNDSRTRVTAEFESTGAGWLEFYWSETANSDPLTGFGFNDGTLIGRLTGATVGAFGSFTITSLTNVQNLDQTGDGNQYTGNGTNQLTLPGTGSNDNIDVGLTGIELDANFFKTLLAGFSITYENISVGTPFASVNPSDCFNGDARPAGTAVGTSGLTSTCDTSHVFGDFFSQPAGDPGIQPRTGVINGGGTTQFPQGPDFIAQSDYNSAVTGIPEPASLALVGLALASMGVVGARRRRG